MTLTRGLTAVVLLLFAAATTAQSPQVASPVPPLTIDDRGELLLAGDNFDYAPWSSDRNPQKVHIVQYFGATRSDSKLFEPLTDRLTETFSRDQYHVTTIINLDAAMWGTSGLVVSEVQGSKREFPDSTMVLDEEGQGVKQWQLGDKGVGLMIVDAKGVVQYFTQQAMDEAGLEQSLKLVSEQIEACLKSC